MALDTVIGAVATILSNVTGIRAVYQEPPNEPDAAVYPFAVVYINSGELTPMGASLVRGIHNLYVEIHQSRTVVPAALTAVQVWPERLFAALAGDTTLAQAQAMVAWPVLYQAGPIEYGNYVHYGIRFTVPVKVH